MPAVLRERARTAGPRVAHARSYLFTQKIWNQYQHANRECQGRPGYDRPMTCRYLHALTLFALTVAACTSSSDSSDAWTRSYLAPRERVFEAVLDVLEGMDYLVDADRDKGRVTANPSRSRGATSPTLVVQVEVKAGRVRVDAQTRSGASYSGVSSRASTAPVLEFFHELDLRLQGGRG